MKLEAGKRYVRRDGVVTDPLTTEMGTERYPFVDPKTGVNYTSEGAYLSHKHCELYDLIREYVEEDEANRQTALEWEDGTPNADRPSSEMTKREAIAMRIMAKLTDDCTDDTKIAHMAVSAANALLAELERSKP